MANNIHSLLTGLQLHFSKLEIINGAPSATPDYTGQTKYDELNNVLWIAIGVSSVNDWKSMSSTTKVTDISGTTYTVVDVDNGYLLSFTNNGARTITLPNAPINGFIIGIQDGSSGGAYAQNITINGNGGLFPGGGTSYVISSDQASVIFIYDMSATTWIPAYEYIGLEPSVNRLGNILGSSLILQTLDTNPLQLNVNNVNAANISTTSFEVKKALLIDDISDNSKQAQVALSSATTGTKTILSFNQTANRTLTFPDITDTLVSKNSTDILTNKSVNNLKFNNPGNTFYTNIIGGNNTGNLALTLPTTAPIAGQVIQSVDTAGTLGWVSAAELSQQYVVSGATYTALSSSTTLVIIGSGPSSGTLIQGIAAGTGGQVITILNLSADLAVAIQPQSSSAPTGNKISIPGWNGSSANSTLFYGKAITLQYEAVTQVWVLVNPTSLVPLVGLMSSFTAQGGNVGESGAVSITSQTNVTSSFLNLVNMTLTQGNWRLSLTMGGGITITPSASIIVTIGISTDSSSGFSDQTFFNSSALNLVGAISSNNTNSSITLVIPEFYTYVSSTTIFYAKMGFSITGGSASLYATTAVLSKFRYI